MLLLLIEMSHQDGLLNLLYMFCCLDINNCQYCLIHCRFKLNVANLVVLMHNIQTNLLQLISFLWSLYQRENTILGHYFEFILFLSQYPILLLSSSSTCIQAVLQVSTINLLTFTEVTFTYKSFHQEVSYMLNFINNTPYNFDNKVYHHVSVLSVLWSQANNIKLRKRKLVFLVQFPFF